jgi:hypothetical protein
MINRIILRISIKPTFWVLPYFWRNRYMYQFRLERRHTGGIGYRMVWLCFDCEFARIPKGASWSPDGAHLQ